LRGGQTCLNAPDGIQFWKLVGAIGFEPTTPCAQGLLLNTVPLSVGSIGYR
jgi:hypothetical protein